MGNTLDAYADLFAEPVHPHTHGEHLPDLRPEVSCNGSSPHAWGTRHLIHPDSGTGRFIPTRMGNTSCRPACRPRPPVHPHTHGEHHAIWSPDTSSAGSSPHAWGTLFILLPIERKFLLPVGEKTPHVERTPLFAKRNDQRPGVRFRILHDHSHIRAEKR